MEEYGRWSDYPEPRSTRRRGRRPVTFVAFIVTGLVLMASALGGAWLLHDTAAHSPATVAGDPLHEGGSAPAGSGDGPSAGPSPSASSASPSSSPSKKPSTAPAPLPPRSGGKPGPGNTGVPAGTRLTTVNGNQVYSTDNQVISGLDIHGFVEITARHVTIKNSIIRGGPNPKCNSAVLYVSQDFHSDASATVQDSEISPSYPSPCLDGMWLVNTTLTRMNIHGAVDGLKAFDNVTVQDSWVHDLSWFASDPNQGGGATHNDAVQTYEGNKHITLRHNNLTLNANANAAYMVSQDLGKVVTDIHITDNWLDGGGCTLNFAHGTGPTPMTGIYITNNRFGRHSTFGCPILVSTKTVLSQNSGNVWDDNGQPIPSPDRHD
jgi:hypothetical protein